MQLAKINLNKAAINDIHKSKRLLHDLFDEMCPASVEKGDDVGNFIERIRKVGVSGKQAYTRILECQYCESWHATFFASVVLYY